VLFYLNQPAVLLGVAMALYVGLVARDAAQVLVAQLLGDPVPRRSGRLSFHPQKKVMVFSVVTMIIAGAGWAEPIPMSDQWRRLRYKVSLAVIAGPLAYLILAFLAVLALRGVTTTTSFDTGERVADISRVSAFNVKLFTGMAYTFSNMFIVSLIPTPPTDGGRILFSLGGTTHGWQNAKYQLEERNFGMVIVMGLLLLPVLFPSFPSVIWQLSPPLTSALGSLVGL
jgi:Zn-dependent protease